MKLFMEKVLVDANFVIALLDTDDSCHKRAVDISRCLENKECGVFINNLILYEVLTVLSMKGLRGMAHEMYEEVRRGAMEIVYTDVTLERVAYDYFEKTMSKNVSFADCAILATAETRGIEKIVSF